MAGCSLSLLRVDDERLARLDAPTERAGLGRGAARARVGPAEARRSPAVRRAAPGPAGRSGRRPRSAAVLRRGRGGAARGGAAPDGRWTSAVGDGDLGISLARGAAAILRELRLALERPGGGAARACRLSLAPRVGGTSGPLYAMFLLRAAGVARGRRPTPDAPRLGDAPSAPAARAIAALGGARPGDRTMLDALLPAAEALAAALARRPAVGARRWAARSMRPRDGAARTATMPPRRGRSSYLGDRALGHADPGAEAVVVWLSAVHHALSPREV